MGWWIWKLYKDKQREEYIFMVLNWEDYLRSEYCIPLYDLCTNDYSEAVKRAFELQYPITWRSNDLEKLKELNLI